MLKGFIRPDTLASMAAEGARLRSQAHPFDKPWYPYPPYDAISEGD